MDLCCVFSTAWAEFDSKVCPTITKTLATPLEIKVGSVQFSHFKSLSTSFLGLYAIVLIPKLYLMHIYKYRPPTQLNHPHNQRFRIVVAARHKTIVKPYLVYVKVKSGGC